MIQTIYIFCLTDGSSEGLSIMGGLGQAQLMIDENGQYRLTTDTGQGKGPGNLLHYTKAVKIILIGYPVHANIDWCGVFECFVY